MIIWKKVEKEIKCLEKKALEELRKILKKVFGEEAPRYSKKCLIPRLAYKIQEKTYGEISRKGAKRLEYLADLLEKGKRISSDKLPIERTELILERGEEVHVVMVTNTGLIPRRVLYVIISGSGKNNGNELQQTFIVGVREKERQSL